MTLLPLLLVLALPPPLPLPLLKLVGGAPGHNGSCGESAITAVCWYCCSGAPPPTTVLRLLLPADAAALYSHPLRSAGARAEAATNSLNAGVTTPDSNSGGGTDDATTLQPPMVTALATLRLNAHCAVTPGGIRAAGSISVAELFGPSTTS